MEKVNRCGYFTGKTTPPGCKKMITDYEQCIAELTAENERLKIQAACPYIHTAGQTLCTKCGWYDTQEVDGEL